MTHPQNPDTIEQRLQQALSQLLRVPQFRDLLAGIEGNRLRLDDATQRLVETKHELWLVTTSLEDVQDWISAHWNAKRQTQPPAGAVLSVPRLGRSLMDQLNDLAAACKLLLAAGLHGVGTVAGHAADYATHGMIEVRSLTLLQGSCVSKETSLDEYVRLLPYEQALDLWSEASRDWSGTLVRDWPPERADNLCALELTMFERRGERPDEFRLYESPLMRCGFENLLLVLGLVWGRGFHGFAGMYGSPDAIAATLPLPNLSGTSGWYKQTAIRDRWGSGQLATDRPLDVRELVKLISRFPDLPDGTQRVLNLAMRRLRDAAERTELADRVIDVCIALETLFMEGEQWDQKKLVARRASWYFADSREERELTRSHLKQFYDDRSTIVHGGVPESLNPEVEQAQSGLAKLTDEVENIVRASLSDMIVTGRPNGWEASKEAGAVRHEPPRPQSEIRSVKSESTSWTVAEQVEIDHALEAVWIPEIRRAFQSPTDSSPIMHQGLDHDEIARIRSQGIPYAISIPIRLYWAHPKWPQAVGQSFDERTAFNCERDVKRHLESWQAAASEKRLVQFVLPLEAPAMYRPEMFDWWRAMLQPLELQ